MRMLKSNQSQNPERKGVEATESAVEFHNKLRMSEWKWKRSRLRERSEKSDDRST